MHWNEIGILLFAPRAALLAVLLVLYAVPLLWILLLPFPAGTSHRSANRWLGLWEMAITPWRNLLGTLYLASAAGWFFWQGVETGRWEEGVSGGIAIAIAVSGIAHHLLIRRESPKLLRFLTRTPSIHPQEFFDRVASFSGPRRHRLPEIPQTTVDLRHLNFRDGKESRWVRRPVFLLGAFNLLWLCRRLLAASRQLPGEAFAALASAGAILLASRLAQLFRMEIAIEGSERLPGPLHPQIFVATHGSWMDALLLPLLFAQRPSAEGERALPVHIPRMILSRCQLSDNILISRLFGFDRLAERLGMILIDQRRPTGPEEAHALATATARLAICGDLPFTLFPQGTQARGQIGAQGERLEAAYYTVGTNERLRTDGAHLKPGAAYIALETLTQLAQQGREDIVQIIPVAIMGTARVCPRKSCRVLSNVRCILSVGEVLPLDRTPLMAPAEALLQRIDAALKDCTHAHANLERRFFEELRAMFDPLQQEEIAVAMKSWRNGDDLVHAILDGIFCLPPEQERAFLRDLTRLLFDFAPRDELLAFKGRIADTLPG
jgi:1-acyl-sn-glycerol-3-phosphate acyltransferase